MASADALEQTLRQRLPQAQHSPAQRDLSRKFHDSLIPGGTPLGEIEHSERFELEIATREARLQRAGALTAHIKQLEQQNELLRVSAATDQLLDSSQNALRHEAPKSRRSPGPSGGSTTGSFLKNRPRVWHPQQN